MHATVLSMSGVPARSQNALTALYFFGFGFALFQGLFRSDWQWYAVALLNAAAAALQWRDRRSQARFRREYFRQLRLQALERFKRLS